jgi:hypothetical protein
VRFRWAVGTTCHTVHTYWFRPVGSRDVAIVRCCSRPNDAVLRIHMAVSPDVVSHK